MLVQLTSPAQMRPNLGKRCLDVRDRNSFRPGASQPEIFSLWRGRCGASQQIPISVANPPSTQISLAAGWKSGGAFGYLYWGLAMVPAQPLHNTKEMLEASSFGRDDDTFDEFTDDDVVSLLEENARLRKLVVRLSEIVLRNVADGK
jgi:hypothetical protein